MKINGEEYYSVSQLDMWSSCHRSWWLQKRCGYINPELEDNPYLLRGKLIHEILEKYFDSEKLKVKVKKHPNYNKLNDKFKSQLINMTDMFLHSCKLPNKEIECEVEIINHKLKMVAYLDVVGDNFIIDYKTSQWRGHIPLNYRWQLKIYSLLYYLKTGKFISNLGVYYLKIGEIKWFKIKEEDLEKIKSVVIETINAIEEYEKNDDKNKCTYSGRWSCPCNKLIKP